MKNSKRTDTRNDKCKFVISICDGFCEYSYEAMLNGDESIRSTWIKIAKALKVVPVEGIMRKGFPLK